MKLAILKVDRINFKTYIVNQVNSIPTRETKSIQRVSNGFYLDVFACINGFAYLLKKSTVKLPERRMRGNYFLCLVNRVLPETKGSGMW